MPKLYQCNNDGDEKLCFEAKKEFHDHRLQKKILKHLPVIDIEEVDDLRLANYADAVFFCWYMTA